MVETMQYVAKLGIDDSDLKTSLSDITNIFKGATGSWALGITAVTTALTYMATTLHEVGIEAGKMDDLSVATGVTMAELEKFHYAARMGGIEVTAYDSLIAKLTLSMGKATDATSEQAAAFARIGISPEGKSTTQVMLEVVDGLENLESGAERAEIAMTLLGRSWVDAYPKMRDFRDWQSDINKHVGLTTDELRMLDAETDEFNKLMADGITNTQKFVVQIAKLSNEVNILKNTWDSLNQGFSQEDLAKSGTGFKTGLDRAPSGIDATIASQQALFAQVEGENRKAAAQELAALNEEYNKGAMSMEEYNTKRGKIANSYVTGGAALLKGGPAGISATGWDQGSQAGYFASGVNGSMGVNASPTQANAYQLQVAAGLYSKYYDQLTGDKFGAQQYRSEIARQLAYNEAAAGYKSQEEAWAAAGYKQGTNITIQNYNMGNASPEEIANATAEKMSRLIAGGL